MRDRRGSDSFRLPDSGYWILTANSDSRSPTSDGPLMLIDRKSRGWVVACLVIFVVATVLYIPYARRSLTGPKGGSWYGLAYGIVGSAMILFVMALAIKKRFRTLRIGRAHTWLQGHVWLGLLAYPMILYHGGLRWGRGFQITMDGGVTFA